MQVFPGNYFNSKLRTRFLGSILMFLEFARLRQACGDLFFFQHEILPCTQLHSACFRAWTDRNWPKENRDFWTHNFPTKRETLHLIHAVCIANVHSLNSLCEAIFSLRYSPKAPSFWVHCDLNVRILTGSDGCLSSRFSLPVRSPSPRKRLYLKFPSFAPYVTAAILVYLKNETAAILVYK